MPRTLLYATVFTACALIGSPRDASAIVLTNDVPTLSAESANPDILPASGLSADYFGIPVINILNDPVELDEYIIAGQKTNFDNDGPVRPAGNWPGVPDPDGPAPIFGRDLNDIDVNDNGVIDSGETLEGSTATWSVTVPAGATVNSIDFTARMLIREQPSGDPAMPNRVDYELDDNLAYVLTAPGSAIDGGMEDLSATFIDDTADGDGTYEYPEASLFADGALSFVTTEETTYSVTMTVTGFTAAAEGFWTTGVLTVDYSLDALLSGDFDGDGSVDAADYAVWRDNVGQTEDGSVLSGNGNGGTVDGSDYSLWAANFGTSSPAVGASVAAVPEPGALLTLLLGCSGWWSAGRARRNRR